MLHHWLLYKKKKDSLSSVIRDQLSKNKNKMNVYLNSVNIFYQGTKDRLTYMLKFNKLSPTEQMVFNAWIAFKLPPEQAFCNYTNSTTVDYACLLKGFDYLKKVSKADMEKARNYVDEFTKLAPILNSQSLNVREEIGGKCGSKVSTADKALGIMFDISCLRNQLKEALKQELADLD